MATTIDAAADWLQYADALEAAIKADPGKHTQFYIDAVPHAQMMEKTNIRAVLHALASKDKVHKHQTVPSNERSRILWWPVATDCTLCHKPHRIPAPAAENRQVDSGPPARCMVNPPEGQVYAVLYKQVWLKPGQITRTDAVKILLRVAERGMHYDHQDDVQSWPAMLEKQGFLHRHWGDIGYFHDSRCHHDPDCEPLPPERTFF